jgi:AcrR family transcriptional regulator
MTSQAPGHAERRTQAQRRRESADRLLAAGVELIAEQGFARTTLAQIGERAGYSRETVRLRHGSKLALLETALRRE